jgi:uncharacterized phage-associated protein
MEYTDKSAKFEFSTEILINEPIKSWASLPIHFTIYNIFFSGKVFFFYYSIFKKKGKKK